ncbi:MAG: putative glycine dehydrogenase (decarboxylating) subunit 2 [Myxococcales bacterium]
MGIYDRATTGLTLREAPIFERSREGRVGFSLPPEPSDAEAAVGAIPTRHRRGQRPALPEVSEVDVIRHFTRLSTQNYSIDLGLYPLGSCTMKYNPRVNEETVRLPGFAHLHPYLPHAWVQGALELMWELERHLAEISGMAAVSLQPAAGAHGEWTGVRVMRRFLIERDGAPRRKMLIPDTAHGTNPASCALNGYDVVQLPSNERGVVSPQVVLEAMDADTAGIMVTNPNTLGLFEENLGTIASIVHDKGGLVYNDGANLNSLLGRARPGDMGVDVMHFNLHKTFSTPHGGGGPGAGPVGVVGRLEPYLPTPRIERDDTSASWRLSFDRPLSVGRVKAFFGNFGMLVRAYTYIREYGPRGLRQVTEMAVANANYVLARLRGTYHVPYDRLCMHECVVSDKLLQPLGVKTMDVAKRLIDYGFHPPTVYFPLCVPGAMMIEPTESEPVAALDELVDALNAIAAEAAEAPDALHEAPTRTAVRRMDEARAARQPVLRWSPGS